MNQAFNEHQLRIWRTMIKLTNNYLEGRINFGYLVNSLEGALDASEITDNKLTRQWYDFWTPLEAINAEIEIKISNKEKLRVVREMLNFLMSKIK